MIGSAPFVGGREKMNFTHRPRPFYIDDILASDFGHGRLEDRQRANSELRENHWTVTDTAAAAADPIDDLSVADSTILLNNTIAASELQKSTCPVARPITSLRPSSSSVISSRRFHDNGCSSSNSVAGCTQQTASSETVKVEICSSTNTEVVADSDEAGTICDVTSSTTSHPVAVMRDRKLCWKSDGNKDRFTLPAWVYCTRYSDRPSAGPRIRRRPAAGDADRRRRRRRTAFSGDQLRQLRAEYEHCAYVSDERRRQLAERLGLHTATIKVWFQNRRASDKKARGVRNELALRLMAEGLYDHHTVNNMTVAATLR